MILLRLISWPYFRRHVLRTLLTTAGIVLGVAVFVGMRAANDAVLHGFRATVDRIAGRTELQVTAGETGFDEAVLERVQAASTVRVAVPVVEATAASGVSGAGTLLVLGVDMTGDRSLRDYDLESGDEAVVDDPLVFLAQPDSIIVTQEFAARSGAGVNGRITLRTAEGPKAFTIRGIMKPAGLATAFGGNLAIMDVYAAQKMFGRGRTFDRIDLAVKDGHSIAECEAELRAMLGPGFQVDPPSSRGQQFEAMLSSYSIMVNITSLFALFIGMFIIYNSFAIAVTQRRTEIGVLRALGASRAQIRALFLGESAITGLVGSALGLGFGLLIARGIAVSIGTLIGDVYGVAQHADDVAATPATLASAVAIGVVTSVVAAFLPARNAARVDPVRALQKGRYQVLSAGESRARIVVASLLAIVSAACLLESRLRVLFYVGYFTMVVAVLLLAPLLSLLFARALRPVLRWIRPVEGALAADSLIQAPRRTSASVAALMLSLAMAIGFAGMAGASYRSIVDWLDSALNPNLFVMPSSTIVVRSVRFPSAVGDEIRRLPGVADVQAVREPRIVFRGTPVTLVAVDLESLRRTAKLPPVAGDADEMYRRTAAGEAAIVSDNLANLQRLKLGDTVEIELPGGVLRLPIAGIVLDYTDQQGTILIDRQLFIRRWGDDTVNVYRVYLTPGATDAEVKQRILDRFDGRRQVFVMTNGDLRAYIIATADQWFALSWVQLAVAVLVAILGIVNTLTVSIIDRRRELGVLRAVGGVNAQIRHTIWLEALGVAALGIALGFCLGAVNLFYLLQVVHYDVGGTRLDYVFPVNVAAVLIPTVLAAAFVAAIWPAEAAVHGSLVEALEYE